MLEIYFLSPITKSLTFSRTAAGFDVVAGAVVEVVAGVAFFSAPAGGALFAALVFFVLEDSLGNSRVHGKNSG
jgi:hypothetical protein